MISRLLVASSLALAAVTPALMLSPSASASQVPPSCAFNTACTWVYYNNGQHSSEVGSKSYNCFGDESITGRTTAYFTFQSSPCS